VNDPYQNVAFSARPLKALRIRPHAVTAIALFQFARAGLILLFALSKWLEPNARLDSRLDTKILVYIAARQNASSILLPLSAIFVAAVGWGLWRLKTWARTTLITTSGVTVFLWSRRFAFDWAIGSNTLQSTAQVQTIYAVILIDLLIFCCLSFYPDVADAFGKQDS
jgi:hypothetical protein